MNRQSLYGLWIDNERIMSTLHGITKIDSRLSGVAERKLLRPDRTGLRNWSGERGYYHSSLTRRNQKGVEK